MWKGTWEGGSSHESVRRLRDYPVSGSPPPFARRQVMSHVLAISKAFIACLDRSEPHERPEKDIAWGSTAGTSTKGPQDAAPESPAGPGHAPVCGIVADMHVPLKALLLCKYTMIPSCGRLRRVDWSLVDGAVLTPSPGAPYRAPESPFHGIRGAEHHPAVSTTHSKYASVINACTGLQAGTLLHSLLGFKSPLPPTLHAPLGPKLAKHRGLALDPSERPSETPQCRSRSRRCSG